MRGLKTTRKRYKFWSQRRRWCAWIGMIAVVFQMAVPLGQGMAAVAFATDDGDANTLPLVICSALGGAVQVANDVGSRTYANVPDSSDPSRTTGPCVFCFACCQARTFDMNVLPVVEVVSLKLKIVPWAYPPHMDRILLSSERSVRYLTRAPPLFA